MPADLVSPFCACVCVQDLSAAPPEMVGRSRSSSDDLTPEEKAPFLASARLRSTEGPIFSYQNQVRHGLVLYGMVDGWRVY